MPKLEQTEVTSKLTEFFNGRELETRPEHLVFNTEDDTGQREFKLDLVTHPFATTGLRSPQTTESDRKLFKEHAKKLDDIVNKLNKHSLFPGDGFKSFGWERMENPNPIVGIAVEIENNTASKYFLGSMLAASMAGRWGLLVAPDDGQAKKWVESMHRLTNKGRVIPTNISVFEWSALRDGIESV